MIISKNGAVKALKEAYKKGYEVLPGADAITICAAKWAAVCKVRQLPVEVSQILVEHAGYIPTYPELVRKGTENQAVIASVVGYRNDVLSEVEQRAARMYQITIVFKGRWQLFVSITQGIFAFDADILAVISEDAFAETFATAEGMGVWRSGEELVYIAPGRFDPEDRQKLQQIASLYASPRVVEEAEPENLCMFDDLEEIES